MRHGLLSVFLFTASLLLSGCGTEKAETPPPPPAKTIEGRLLCASNLAYHGVTDGTVNEKAPWFHGSGFTEKPVSIVGGPGGIHVCIIGKTKEGITIAFRGTLPPSPVTMASFTDWMNNVILLPPDVNAHGKGKVHQGFGGALDVLWPGIEKTLKNFGCTPQTAISITGHSKGGAVAFTCAARMKESGLYNPTLVVTFGAPRCGDTEFSKSLSSVKVIRYENAGDLVPLMPPDFALIAVTSEIPYVGATLAKAQDWEFEHTGELRYLTAEGKIESGGALLFIQRGQDLFNLLKSADKGAGALLDAHNCGCGSGYQRAVAPDLNCAEK
jgi:Lipase (class 3)